MLKTLQELDPQYDINLAKYKNLTDGDLEEEIIALQKADITIKKLFPRLEKVKYDKDKSDAIIAGRGEQ